MGNKIENKYINEGNYATLRITSKTHGVFDFLIDDEDVDKCKEIHWSVNKYYGKARREYYYASNSKVGLLHRFIMKAEKGKDVDHIDGNTLDNRKAMLQVCEHNENIMKARQRSDNDSGRVGVSYFKNTNKWMAYININKKRKHLGYFNTMDEAAIARELAENKHWENFKPIDVVLANE